MELNSQLLNAKCLFHTIRRAGGSNQTTKGRKLNSRPQREVCGSHDLWGQEFRRASCGWHYREGHQLFPPSSWLIWEPKEKHDHSRISVTWHTVVSLVLHFLWMKRTSCSSLNSNWSDPYFPFFNYRWAGPMDGLTCTWPNFTHQLHLMWTSWDPAPSLLSRQGYFGLCWISLSRTPTEHLPFSSGDWSHYYLQNQDNHSGTFSQIFGCIAMVVSFCNLQLNIS